MGLTAIPVFYCEGMVAQVDSFSPSAGKPRAVLAAWVAAQLPITVASVTPIGNMDFCLAHDPDYVAGVLDGALENGFGNKSAVVARSLPYTSGAMLDAARAAMSTGCACAPVSGFHHACYNAGGGYCTFNGLVIAARKMLEEARLKRVLVLDCDMHYGNGTDDILDHFELMGSIHNVTFGRWYQTPADAPRYLRRLRETLDRLSDYELVLYQAGADVHVDDPLGGVLTTEQMQERDRMVFDAARASRVPLAWNLAGGYQEPLAKVIALHVNTMAECRLSYGV